VAGARGACRPAVSAPGRRCQPADPGLPRALPRGQARLPGAAPRQPVLLHPAHAAV